MTLRRERRALSPHWGLVTAVLLPSLSIALTGVSAQQTSLLDGLFVTRNDVSNELAFAFDTADMRETTDTAEKRSIYEKGRHSKTLDEGGNEVPRSIASLSIGSASVMMGDPMYNLFRHAFLDLGTKVENEDMGMFDDKPVGQYANTVVDDLFDLNEEDIETEAAIVMVIWQRVSHELHNVMKACKRKDVNTKADMLSALDRAAALWIGDFQEVGDSESGALLYNIAERSGERFGPAAGQVKANVNIISAMNEIQRKAEDDTCFGEAGYWQFGEAGYIEVRNIVEDTYGHMTVPMVQQLIHHMMQAPNESAEDFVELYSLAILPRVAYCDPAAYSKLLDYTVTTKFSTSTRDDTIKTLQSVYSCLHVSCDSIGTYENGALEACTEDTSLQRLAGYVPHTDVKQWSNIDRDIMQISAFMNLEAYDAAREYYKYGHNSRVGEGLMSLRDLAVSDTNKAVTQFVKAVNYYGANNYSDFVVLRALDTSKDTYLSPDQRSEIVMGTLRNEITFIAVLAQLQSALNSCGTAADVVHFDRAAALFIGSLEGPTGGGGQDGKLLYAVGKQLCGEFDNCMPDGNAPVNQAIVQSLSNGRDSFLIQECLKVKDIIEQSLFKALPVCLVQGTLQYSTTNELLVQGSEDGALGAGYSFSRSVVPMLLDIDPSLSDLVDRNMRIDPATSIVEDGANGIFDTFREAFASFSFPVTCHFIGINNYDNLIVPDVCQDMVIPPLETLSPSPLPPPGTPTAQPVVPTPPPPTQQPQPSVAPTPPPVVFPTLPPAERYRFTTDVDIYEKIALDIRDMRNAPDSAAFLKVYMEGENSVLESGGKTTIEGFSTDAGVTMAQNPMFSIFRHALAGEKIFGGSIVSDETYANIIVQNAIKVTDDTNLATVAAVIIDIWMEVTHHLDESIRACETGGDTSHIDAAVALWIGQDQPEGVFDKGYLLYSIAQEAAQHLGHPETEADTNKELIKQFNEAKKIFLECENGDASVSSRLRFHISTVYQKMAIPLLQNLIYYIVTEVNATERNYVKLYALSIIPQASACNPAGYKYLMEKLVDANVEEKDFNGVFLHLKELMQCLRIDCDTLSLPPSPVFLRAYKYLCLDDGSETLSIAGYEPQVTFFAEDLRLDLDILQIGIFVETGATEAALATYTYGRNARGTTQDSLYRIGTLQSLAKSIHKSRVPVQYQAFKNYFGENDYGDVLVMNLLGVDPNVDTKATDSESVVRTLQVIVSYMAVLEKLYTAVDECLSNAGGPDDDGAESWDLGVALLVGSIEGKYIGGNPGGGGTLMYALANEMCASFGSCVNGVSGVAAVNTRMMEALASGKQLLINDDCEGTLALLTKSVIDIFPVPLVQGTLLYASLYAEVEEGSSDSRIIAAGHELARSVLPLVKDAGGIDAVSPIQGHMFQLATDEGPQAVFDAFTDILPSMGIDCQDVGKYGDNKTSVCVEEEKRPEDPADTPTELADGLYTTTTYVQDRANIALDVSQMEMYLTNKDKTIAREIYERGGNSDIFNENGVKIGQRTLANFSTSATFEMLDEPMFSMFTYGLQDENGEYGGRDVRLYADTIVREAFDNPGLGDLTLASEAVVVHSIWMFTVHELYETLRRCKQKVIADADGVHSIDEVVAYWIGDGQQTGNAKQGHLLYALAEKQGDLFRQEHVGQTRTNANILNYFNEAKIELSFPNACVDNPSTYPRLRQIVNKIITQMTIPIIQGYIHSLRNSDTIRAKMFAKAFVPRVAGCNKDTFKFLKKKMNNWSANDVDALVEAVESTYSCFGLTCEDIGNYRYYDGITCKNEDAIMDLGGYTPESDIAGYARLDLDALHIQIYMNQGALGAAADMYKHGQHGIIDDQTLSFYQLATSSSLPNVPEFDSFVRYYGSDRYANDLIQRGLTTSLDPRASTVQRTALVNDTIGCLVAFMASLSAMHEALDDCLSVNTGRQKNAGIAWDKAAAFQIGSIGSTRSGIMLHGIANEICELFDTCDSAGEAKVNKKLVTLLYAGRAEVNVRACSALSKTIKEIVPMMLVPLIQGTLHYSLVNSNALNVFGTGQSGSIASGYVLSRSILPLVDKARRASASTINKNMDWVSAQTIVRSDPVEVWSAFEEVYDDIKVNCKMVGGAGGYNACTGTETGKSSTGNSVLLVGIIMATVASLSLVALAWVKGGKMKDEPASFVTNEKGILNNDSEASLISSTSSSGATRDEDMTLTRNEEGVLDHDSEAQDIREDEVNHDEPMVVTDREDGTLV